jgi:hypothetical protein
MTFPRIRTIRQEHKLVTKEINVFMNESRPSCVHLVVVRVWVYGQTYIQPVNDILVKILLFRFSCNNVLIEFQISDLQSSSYQLISEYIRNGEIIMAGFTLVHYVEASEQVWWESVIHRINLFDRYINRTGWCVLSCWCVYLCAPYEMWWDVWFSDTVVTTPWYWSACPLQLVRFKDFCVNCTMDVAVTEAQ